MRPSARSGPPDPRRSTGRPAPIIPGTPTPPRRGIPTAPGHGTGSRGPGHGAPDRDEAGPGVSGRRSGGRRLGGRGLRRLLAGLGMAMGAAVVVAVVVVGCVGAGQDAPSERILRHEGQFAVGTFNPPAARAAGTAVSREGTLVVHGGCLALASSAPGGRIRAVAVPVGSSLSERGTVYVADTDTGRGDPERAGGPVMAGHLGGPARFAGPEVTLGGMQAQDLVRPPGCATPDTRVLLVIP
jgi:hypothetical protein